MPMMKGKGGDYRNTHNFMTNRWIGMKFPTAWLQAPCPLAQTLPHQTSPANMVEAQQQGPGQEAVAGVVVVVVGRTRFASQQQE